MELTLFYLQDIPETAEITVPVAHLPTSQANEAALAAAAAVPTSGAPNTSPLNLFPQVEFLTWDEPMSCLVVLFLSCQSPCRKLFLGLLAVDLDHLIS